MRVLIPLIILAFPFLLLAQTWNGPEISGLFEHQLSARDSYNNWLWFAQNQLRLTIKSNQIAHVSAEATLAAISYHGQTELSPIDIVPEPLRDQVQTMPAIQFDDRIYLDRAMIDMGLGKIQFQIGIQPLRWGTGYAWNPTDLFTIKSPTDPAYIEEGVNALKITIPWRTDGTISGILVPEDTWKESGKAIKWLDHIVGFDVSLSYLERTLPLVPVPAYSGRERYLGWDLTGEILGPGIWTEGSVLLDPEQDDPLRVVVGMDYTIQHGWYFKAEAFHNGSGKSSSNDYTANDWLTMIYRSNISLGKEYALLGVEKTIGDFWRAALYGIGNLSDRSVVINPWIYYNLSMSSEIILSAAIPVGDDIDEFHPGTAVVFIRFHVYF